MQKDIVAQDPATSKADIEQKAISKLVTWRRKDRAALADKRSRDAQRGEYSARGELRQVADQLDGGES